MGYRQNQAFYLVSLRGDAGRRTPDTHRDAGHKHPSKTVFGGTNVKQNTLARRKSVRHLAKVPSRAARPGGLEEEVPRSVGRLDQPRAVCIVLKKRGAISRSARWVPKSFPFFGGAP